MKICLIIDESAVIRKVAKRIMELLEFVVLEAGSGEEAMKLCFDNQPDLILVNWQMSDMSGVDFIAAYREMQKSRPLDDTSDNVQTRIIYCTSELKVAEMTKAKRAGANGFLMKPFSREMVESRLIELGLIGNRSSAAA